MSSTPTPVKQHSSYQDQIQNLLDNGLQIADTLKAQELLKKVNYYRLSGYMRFFKDRTTGKFDSKATLENVFRLYEFDRRLRQLVMGQLEIIEVMFRSRISFRIADFHGPLAYKDPQYFKDPQQHATFLVDLDKEISRSSKVTFVAHHIQNYGGNLPIWVAIEVMSFGTLSKLYGNISTTDQKGIAKEFGTSHEHVESWLRHFCLIRNICAHYSRVYGRMFSFAPKIYKRDKGHFFVIHPAQQRTFYGTLYAMRKLLSSEEQWTSFLIELDALLEEYKDVVTLTELGLDKNWLSKMR
ncbi:hypothetical protein CBW65_09755 [Tumebacillus avium]|uniref:Abortive phage resistance protein n=1 Tax=Tumebacillus avium TaxID=1903704 RepID=A0A1Y0IN46_9BACL|nr:Abi family protein [Tumebacillus avium]ARU61246.1 hypothetical protein CBW65_09755 [Tumebacillus avium]